MRPHLSRVRLRHIVPRPLTLKELGLRLTAGRAEVLRLVNAGHFPHAYLDTEGQLRVPAPDIDAYLRSRTAALPR